VHSPVFIPTENIVSIEFSSLWFEYRHEQYGIKSLCIALKLTSGFCGYGHGLVMQIW